MERSKMPEQLLREMVEKIHERKDGQEQHLRKGEPSTVSERWNAWVRNVDH